ncbi:uncharacterized protein B0T15DRAFT_513815 [Chaetomium strumarium]|uniref:F-box domain-containing protein n=1 Tax=Chaetomium strumarium TaxID=1170767 RepID=A0AAJ0GPC7_9PEZI|nr:hypothetical protein B0T15DRAFT_513815 [Chaetomium strumarium]
MGRRPQIKGYKAVGRFQPSRACAPRLYFSHFLSLPMELRCRVYDNLLRSPHAIDVSGTWYQKPRLTMSLLRVSKSVSAEAADWFYSVNTFVLLEDCDANTQDDNDIEKSVIYPWLLLIQKYAPSLRSVQIRIRRERPVMYYRELLSMLAHYAPNITRMALVAEGHQFIDLRRTHSSVFHWFYKWHPNEVMAFKGTSLSGGFASEMLAFENLRLVVIGGRQPIEVMDKLCARLEKCRVIGLEDYIAGREAFDLWETAWHFRRGFDINKWYDATMVRGDNGERTVKQTAEDDEQRVRND